MTAHRSRLRQPAAAALDGAALVADPAARHRRRRLRRLSLFWPGHLRPCRWCCSGAPTPSPTASSRSAPPSWAPAATTGQRWWLALTGVLGIVAGLIAFFAPVLTGGILLIFIAIWAIAIGVMAIVGAIQLRKEIEGEWLLILAASSPSSSAS